jgi:hypothetical protein
MRRPRDVAVATGTAFVLGMIYFTAQEVALPGALLRSSLMGLAALVFGLATHLGAPPFSPTKAAASGKRGPAVVALCALVIIGLSLVVVIATTRR